MKFEINGIGRFLIQKQSKGVFEFIWSGILLLIVFYIGIRFGMEVVVFQIIMYIWACLIFLTISVFAPIYIKSKIKKVILEIEFLNGEIKIGTKKEDLYLRNIEIKKVKNQLMGFGKTHANGFILKNKNETKEYWLIITFFNEIEEIEYELKNFM